MPGKIVRIGSWNKFGTPTGWTLDGTGHENQPWSIIHITASGKDGKVLVGGVEIVEWSDDRRKAMEEGE